MKLVVSENNLIVYKIPDPPENRRHSEIANYDWSTGQSNNGYMIGDFTLVVWDETTKVGIGMATGNDPWYGTQTYVVAQYTPRKLNVCFT